MGRWGWFAQSRFTMGVTLGFLVGCGVLGCGAGAGGGGPGPEEGGSVVSTTPADGATNVAIDAQIIITFTGSANPASLDGGIAPNIQYDLAWSADDTVLTVTPAEPLGPGITYTVTLSALTFADGLVLGQPYVFRFTTAGGGPEVTDKMSLWTGGTQLRGANIYQRRVYPELDGTEFMGDGPVGPPLTQQDFTDLAAFGANYVNISHPGLYTENPPYEVDEDVQDNLDRILDMAEQADLFVVITFRTGPGRSEFAIFWGQDTDTDPEGGWFDPSYYNNEVWTSQDAQDAWADMWRYAADRYKDNPVVVGYDLMCEPNAEEVFFGIWGEPAEFYPAHAGSLYDWNQFYPDIVVAIREVDGDTPILVEPMGWASAVWLPYLETTDDTRTVYTIHQYEPSAYTHQPVDSLDISYPGSADLDWDGNEDTFDRFWLDNLLVSTVDAFQEEHNLPVAVNECGPQRFEPGAGQYMDDLLDLFEQRGMNHAFWEWSSSWPPQQQGNDAFDFLHGPDPDNHTDLQTSDHIEAVREHWGQNALRPSNVTFTE